MAAKKKGFAVPMGHVKKATRRAVERFAEGEEEHLHVRVPAELHRKLKLKAAADRTTARELVIRALEAIL